MSFYFEIAWVHLKLHGVNFENYGSDRLGLVKVIHGDISNHMDESAILGEIALTTILIVLGFA